MRARILAEARRMLDSQEEDFICVALQRIADRDHRRKVKTICDGLIDEVTQGIDHLGTMCYWLHTQGLPHTAAPAARLAWLDKLIEKEKAK